MDLPVYVDYRGRGSEGDPRYWIIFDRLGQVICDTYNCHYGFTEEESHAHMDALAAAINKSTEGETHAQATHGNT